jgi:DNA-binding CsgD family transcriptional regulator
MSRSSEMHLNDVTGVCQLVGECHELWADADGWREHLLRGGCRLTGMSVGTFSESRLSADRKSSEVLGEIDRGWRDEAAASHRTRMFEDYPDRVAFLPRLYRLAGQAIDEPGKVISALRPEIRCDEEWYRSTIFNDYHRPAFVDSSVMSFFLNRRTGNLIFLQFCQDLSDRPPTRRTKSIVSLLNRRIAPLVGIALCSTRQNGFRGLSPRLRQTLQALLTGDSEKQIAARMHLSPPTVHEYIAAVYRHFQVNARAELMAYFIRRRPAGGASANSGTPTSQSQ